MVAAEQVGALGRRQELGERAPGFRKHVAHAVHEPVELGRAGRGRSRAARARGSAPDAPRRRRAPASSPTSRRRAASARCRDAGAAARGRRRGAASCCRRAPPTASSGPRRAGRRARCARTPDRNSGDGAAGSRRRARRAGTRAARRRGCRRSPSTACAARRRRAGPSRRGRSRERGRRCAVAGCPACVDSMQADADAGRTYARNPAGDESGARAAARPYNRRQRCPVRRTTMESLRTRLTLAACLPEDRDRALLVGRVWLPAVGRPRARARHGGRRLRSVRASPRPRADSSSCDDPVARDPRRRGTAARIGSIADVLANSAAATTPTIACRGSSRRATCRRSRRPA